MHFTLQHGPHSKGHRVGKCRWGAGLWRGSGGLCPGLESGGHGARGWGAVQGGGEDRGSCWRHEAATVRGTCLRSQVVAHQAQRAGAACVRVTGGKGEARAAGPVHRSDPTPQAQLRDPPAPSQVRLGPAARVLRCPQAKPGLGLLPLTLGSAVGPPGSEPPPGGAAPQPGAPGPGHGVQGRRHTDARVALGVFNLL